MAHRLQTYGLLAFMLIAGTVTDASTTHATMTIDVTYDSTVTSSLSGAGLTTFENAFSAAVSQFESALTNLVTINIDVSIGSVNGVALSSSDASGSFDPSVSMGATAASSSANTEAALANTGAVLPATDPTGGGHYYYMPQAEVKALALSPVSYPTSNPFDGYIGFSSSFAFSYSGTPAAGQYSFKTAAEHEIEEVLGRTSYLNSSGTTSAMLAEPMDLFRYTAPGVASYTENTANGGTPAYASIDGGVTDLGTFADQTTGGDRTDWQTPVNTTSTDAQNSLLATGNNEGLSISDEDVLKGLGYKIAANNGNGLFNGANAPVGATASVNASQPVPEPATLSLLAIAAGLTGLTRRRLRAPGAALSDLDAQSPIRVNSVRHGPRPAPAASWIDFAVTN